MPRLHFLGAAGTVTGSRFLVEGAHARVLIDCGLFQGDRALRSRNWNRVPVFPLDAVVLTHAHIDHSGYLPRLVRDGFHGPVLCSEPSVDLLAVMLRDAAFLAEEDARRTEEREGVEFVPLYTLEDAEAAIALARGLPYDRVIPIAEGITVELRRAGHILGAAHLRVVVDGVSVVFSGDVGRWDAPLLRDPNPFHSADVLVIESTYGDRLHPEVDPTEQLAAVLDRVGARGGKIVIPAFAVGRTQELLWRLRQLEDAGRLGPWRVVIDSPMAAEVTSLYGRYPGELDTELATDPTWPYNLFPTRLEVARTVDESKALRHAEGPLIVLSASGMCNGGRVLHHLAQRLDDPRNAVCIVGFMAEETLGRKLLDGEDEVRIHGVRVPVRAEIVPIQALSAHADQSDLLRWADALREPPGRTYVVHGEPASAATLVGLIGDRMWPVEAARFGQIVELEPR